MLKMGGYGFIRLSMPITPDASEYFSFMMIVLSLIAVTYIGFVALMQKDMKKLIAYSSISHMGFVTLGFFIVWSYSQITDASLGVMGGMVQMISHGLISGAMFLCVGVLYDRVHSREISDYGGVANTMPVFAAFMVFSPCPMPDYQELQVLWESLWSYWQVLKPIFGMHSLQQRL